LHAYEIWFAYRAICLAHAIAGMGFRVLRTTIDLCRSTYASRISERKRLRNRVHWQMASRLELARSTAKRYG
jgi:hypothetical protein